MSKWVVCRKGEGRERRNNITEKYVATFPIDCLGEVREETEDTYTLWLIASDTIWVVLKPDVDLIDVTQTGDTFDFKICNRCFCLKPTEQFEKNQNNKKRQVRRPSCKQCRTRINMRSPKASQEGKEGKILPSEGEPFWCPCCRRWYIAFVNRKIVSDHNHGTGNIRGPVCDPCNTGLGRFDDDVVCLRNALKYLEGRDAPEKARRSESAHKDAV